MFVPRKHTDIKFLKSPHYTGLKHVYLPSGMNWKVPENLSVVIFGRSEWKTKERELYKEILSLGGIFPQ